MKQNKIVKGRTKGKRVFVGNKKALKLLCFKAFCMAES